MSNYAKLQATYDSMVPDLDDECSDANKLEGKKQYILNGFLAAAAKEDDSIDIIEIFTDYMNYIARGEANEDQIDDLYMFINQMIAKPKWLNLNAGERVVEQAFIHAAELAAKEELSF